MRISVLIYGRLNKCIEHYENFIWAFGKEHTIDFFLSSDNSNEQLLNDFIQLYKPIRYTNDPIHYNCDLANYPGKQPETNIHNMTCHFINKWRVFTLLEDYIYTENIQYDCVISLRVDLVFSTICNFENLEENTIYIPSGFDYIDRGINDQFAYGTFEVMKKYNLIYLNMIPLLESGLSIPHPESLTYANIHYYNINIKRINITHSIER